MSTPKPTQGKIKSYHVKIHADKVGYIIVRAKTKPEARLIADRAIADGQYATADHFKNGYRILEAVEIPPHRKYRGRNILTNRK